MFTFIRLIFVSLFSSAVLVRGHGLQHGINASLSGVDTNVHLEEEKIQIRDREHVELNRRQVCGAGVGSCPTGQCCSIGGQCGTGHTYCDGPNCQLEYGPACDGNISPSGSSTINVPRPVLGSVPYGTGIYHCTEQNVIALTFDDGPYNFTNMVLATLAKYNVTATFFINGNSLGKGRIDDPSTPWPQILRNMHAAGHQLASHTWTHQDLTSLPPNLMANQVVYNEMAFRNILGFFPTYLRPPYGYCAGYSSCSAYLNSMGYHIIMWDVDTKDYLNDDPSLIINSEQYFAGNTSSPANGHSYIPLAHDIHLNTALTLVTYMLDTLLARGYKVVTIGECLGDPRSNWYRDGVTGGVVASSSSSSAVTKGTSTSIATQKSTSTVSSKFQALSALAISTTTTNVVAIQPTTSQTISIPTTPAASTVPKPSSSRMLAPSWQCFAIFICWAIIVQGSH